MTLENERGALPPDEIHQLVKLLPLEAKLEYLNALRALRGLPPCEIVREKPDRFD